MFDERGMLTDRARGILFWFTMGMIALLAIAVIVFLVNLLVGAVTPPAPDLVIVPGEVKLCPSKQQQFTVEGGADVAWEATGGEITQSGFFTAGNAVGDFRVKVTGRDSRREAEAVVHIVPCLPTATPMPTATPQPTATPEPVTPVPADPQGDVGAYSDGSPVAGAPSGIDISAASVGPDLRAALQPTEGVPAGLEGLAGEGEALLWIALHDPIPDPPAAGTQWLFVLDVDGNRATGRPSGYAGTRINPDLGDEVAVWVSYGANGYQAGSLVWGGDGWVQGPVVRYRIGQSRMMVGLAFSLNELNQALSQAGAATVAPEAIKGRAAAESYVGERRVIDFYPDLP